MVPPVLTDVSLFIHLHRVVKRWYTVGMQFQVPQFIEVEDKIFGPFTFKQFVYVAGGAGLSFVLWRQLPLFVSFPLIGIVMGVSIALAFMQYNNRPFILAVESAFYFYLKDKLYLWNADTKKKSKKAAEQALAQAPVHVPTLSESKLHDLAWSLDIQDKVRQAGVVQARPSPFNREMVGLGAIRTARDAQLQ